MVGCLEPHSRLRRHESAERCLATHGIDRDDRELKVFSNWGIADLVTLLIYAADEHDIVAHSCDAVKHLLEAHHESVRDLHRWQ